jgi:fatty acid-binding protein DegV
MVRIITDSAADFEPWELADRQITCIPLTVMFGAEQ